MAKRHPLDTIRRAKAAGINEVTVAVSGGKDSVAALALCKQHFAVVRAYFMFTVPGLSFQERYLGYLERKFEVDIWRVPHWMLSLMFRSGAGRHLTEASLGVRKTRARHHDAWMREKYGVGWIATGEKYSDSLERNTQMVKCDGVNEQRQRLWPIAWWTHHDVQAYLTRLGVMFPPDYRLRLDDKRNGSFGSLLRPAELIPIRDNYPEDYQKILRQFPLAEAMLKRWEMMRDEETADQAGGSDEVPDSADRASQPA